LLEMKLISASAGPPKKSKTKPVASKSNHGEQNIMKPFFFFILIIAFVDVPAKAQHKQVVAPIVVDSDNDKEKKKQPWMSWPIAEDKCGYCEASDSVCHIPKGSEKKLKDWIVSRSDAIVNNTKISPCPQKSACGPCKHHHHSPCIFTFFSELMDSRDTYGTDEQPSMIVNQPDLAAFASGMEEFIKLGSSFLASLDKHTEAINQHKEAMISHTLAITKQAKAAKVSRKGKERQMEEDE